MEIEKIAKTCNCSVSRVYQLAKQLGRMPTAEEVNARKGKRGRPNKYKEKGD